MVAGPMSPPANDVRPAIRREEIAAGHYHVPEKFFPGPPAAVAFEQAATPTGVRFIDFPVISRPIRRVFVMGGMRNDDFVFVPVRRPATSSR